MALGGNEKNFYREKRYSLRAVSAMVLGCLSALLFVVLAAVGTALKGEAGMWAGALGTSAFICAVTGVILGLGSFRDRCRSYNMSKAGAIISGIVTAVWFLVFCAGIM